MEDFTQYIVIAGIIIAAIVNLIKKAKESKENTSTQTAPVAPSTDSKKDFPTNWDEWFLGDEKSEEQLPVITEISPSTREEIRQAAKVKPSDIRREVVIAEPMRVSESPSHPILIQLDSVDEARKAVLYAEIFNRKY